MTTLNFSLKVGRINFGRLVSIVLSPHLQYSERCAQGRARQLHLQTGHPADKSEDYSAAS